LKFEKENLANEKLRFPAECNELGINDKLHESSYLENESIDMSKLNLFTDENFLSYSKPLTKDNPNFEEIDIKTAISKRNFYVKNSGKDQIENIKFDGNDFNNNLNNDNLINKTDRRIPELNNDENVNLKHLQTNFFNINSHEKTHDNPKNILKKNVPIVNKYELFTETKFSSVNTLNVSNYEKDNAMDSSPIVEKKSLKSKYVKEEDLNKIINSKPLYEEKVLHIKEKNIMSTVIHNPINEERAILKLDYIFSILKVIDKYQQ